MAKKYDRSPEREERGQESRLTFPEIRFPQRSLPQRAFFIATQHTHRAGKYWGLQSLAIDRRSRCGSARGSLVVSLHFSP
jgi:hypothetical protein